MEVGAGEWAFKLQHWDEAEEISVGDKNEGESHLLVPAQGDHWGSQREHSRYLQLTGGCGRKGGKADLLQGW